MIHRRTRSRTAEAARPHEPMDFIQRARRGSIPLSFAAHHEKELDNPTASRRSHEKVVVVSVMHLWPMEVLDIGAAFLRGMTSDELEADGLKRQSGASVPDDEW